MGAAGQANSQKSGSSVPPPRQTEPLFLVIGRILRPHGVRGELKIELHTDYPERLSQHPSLFLGPEHQNYPLEGVRFHKGNALIKLAGCDDRNTADELRGLLVQIPVEWAVPLEEGEFYHFQIVGVKVITEQGEHLGEITEVIETGANDVYSVKGPHGVLLIPAIDEVVRELDLNQRRMVINPLPGLFDQV